MKYIYGSWGHIFHENGPETMVRFCFDTEQSRLIHLDILRQSVWKHASRQEVSDVEKSIHDNSDALDNPDDYGLEQSNQPPDWVTS